MSHLLRATGAILCALGLSLGANAQTTPPAGRLLPSNCFQCHGTNGKGPGFDRLAGKEGNGIMAKHAMGYTDAQLLSLSGWLSTQR